MLSSITGLVAAHRGRLEEQRVNAEITISDLRRMANQAITELDERHKQDTQTAARMFDNLILREESRLKEIKEELATGEQLPEMLPALPRQKGKTHNGKTAV